MKVRLQTFTNFSQQASPLILAGQRSRPRYHRAQFLSREISQTRSRENARIAFARRAQAPRQVLVLELPLPLDVVIRPETKINRVDAHRKHRQRRIVARRLVPLAVTVPAIGVERAAPRAQSIHIRFAQRVHERIDGAFRHAHALSARASHLSTRSSHLIARARHRRPTSDGRRRRRRRRRMQPAGRRAPRGCFLKKRDSPRQTVTRSDETRREETRREEREREREGASPTARRDRGVGRTRTERDATRRVGVRVDEIETTDEGRTGDEGW